MSIPELSGLNPLEPLIMRTPIAHVRDFLEASTTVREALLSQEGPSVVVLPLRGSIPMHCAAAGVNSVEPLCDESSTPVEIAIGTFQYEDDRTGAMKTTSPEAGQKKRLIYAALEQVDISPDTRVTVLDEVQRGGTVVPLVQHTTSFIHDRGLSTPLRLIAAEDSRPKIASAQKTPGYQRMAADEMPGVATTVVRMPLVACDREALLDTVISDSLHNKFAYAAAESTVVLRNERARGVFRCLGTMMRHKELAEDGGDFLQTEVETRDLSEQASGRLVRWMKLVFNNNA